MDQANKIPTQISKAYKKMQENTKISGNFHKICINPEKNSIKREKLSYSLNCL